MSGQKIIAIVGMSGAGKSETAEFFKEKGFTVLRFGSVIVDGLAAGGLPITPENESIYRHKIRKELGMAAVAIKMLPKIREQLKKESSLVVDGLYSWEEYIYLNKELPTMLLLCIYARPEIRYQRLAKRKDRPFTSEQARERDIHEIEVINKGGPIAFADYLIKNESTKQDLAKELEKYLKWLQNA